MALSSFKINGHFFIRLYSVKSSFYRRVTGQILKNDQGLSTVFLRLFSSNEWSLQKEKKSRTKKCNTTLHCFTLRNAFVERQT